MRWPLEFYYDYLQFDWNKSLNDIQDNIAVSTWLNKSSINKFWKYIMKILLDKVALYDHDNLSNFVFENMEVLICLMWVFNFYSHICWKWITEKWGLNSFKSTVATLIEWASLDRKKRQLMYSFLSTYTYEELWSKMINRINDADSKLYDDTISNSTNLLILKDNELMWSDKLAMIQASFISKYLDEMIINTQSVKNSTWVKLIENLS